MSDNDGAAVVIEDFVDAVYADAEMTWEQKAEWLHVAAKERQQKLDGPEAPFNASALQTLQELTGSQNPDNPWLGVVSAVALAQIDRDSATARADASERVVDAARAVRDAWLYGARDIEELGSLHDAIEAYDTALSSGSAAREGGGRL